MPMLQIGLIIAGVGVLISVFALVIRRKLGRILATPVRRTGQAAAAPGPAAVEGAVRAQQPLVSPVMGKPCVYYQLKLEKKVKEKHGTNTTTRWKTVAEPHAGSTFWLDDGSGPLAVAGGNKLDADLEQTFSGTPPQNVLANLPPPSAHPGEQILELRVIEKVIGLDGKLFALGEIQNGQLGGKLLVSSRGRDALVGSTRRRSLGLFALAGALAAAGATVAVVRPGEARPCGALVDTQHACSISTQIVEKERDEADGSKKHYKLHEKVLDWQVTKDSKFELELEPFRKQKKDVNPVIQVEDELGLPMNVGLNFGLSTAASNDYHTKTKTLHPGKYRIYAWASEDGPSDLVISIATAPSTTAEK